MESRKVILSAPDGLHARPAGELVKLVKGFTGSSVSITAGGRTVNAASMLSLLSLGLKCGSELEIGVHGGDEAAVLDAVTSFIQSINA
ncbi:MAG: HPr family phosphocarrier protein [Bacteroidales bacterium]|nr:HPr family phosphocarrier protein [Bacteroidales bacterium]